MTALLGPWVARIIADHARGTLSKNAGPRAAELRDLLTRLGPTFVKLAQALSVRPDIVSPDDMNELRGLCDAVPSVSNDIAFRMMEDELGWPVHDMFQYISEKPIAAAWLG